MGMCSTCTNLWDGRRGLIGGVAFDTAKIDAFHDVAVGSTTDDCGIYVRNR